MQRGSCATATGADWQTARNATLVLRLYGSDERYRQTFSSISNLPNFGDPTCTYRCGETPTQFSYVPDQRARRAQLIGASPSAQACFSSPEPTPTTSASGIASRPTPAPPHSPILHDHQRDSAAYVEAMWVHNAWTIVASAPHGLVPELRRPRDAVERRNMDCRPPLSRRSAMSASSIRASASRANFPSTGRSRPRASAPFARPRPASSIAPRKSATSSLFPTAVSSASAPRDGKRASLPSAPGAPFAPATSSPRSIAPSSLSPSIPTPRRFCSCARISARSRAAAFLSTTSLHPRSLARRRRRLSVRACCGLARHAGSRQLDS